MKRITVNMIFKALEQRGIKVDDYYTNMEDEFVNGHDIACISRIVNNSGYTNVTGASVKCSDVRYVFAYKDIEVISERMSYSYGMFVTNTVNNDDVRKRVFNSFIDNIVNAFEEVNK